MDLKELDLVDPHEHWYYQSKLTAIKGALEQCGYAGAPVVDVGAGSGFFASEIVGEYPGVRAWCVDPNYADSEIGTTGSVDFVREVSSDQIASASVVLFIDVLEHVEDDTGLLRSYVTNCSPGTYVIITVPAFTSLWSAHDVFLEHYRRYRLSDLVAVARACGLEIVHSRYLFGTTFLPLWMLRRMTRNSEPKSQMKPVPHWINYALTRLLNVEHRGSWNPIAGSSVLLVARAP